MQSFERRPVRVRLLFLSSLLLLSLICCNSESDITGVEGGGGLSLGGGSKAKDEKEKKAAKDKREKDGEAEGGFDTDGERRNPDGTLKEPEGSARSEEAEATPAPIEYPTLEFNARGLTSCQGDTYNTTASIITSISDADLTINMVAAKIFCGGKCQKEADQQIAQSIGMTRYVRTTKAEKAAAAKNGFEDALYAIFANGVTKERTGQSFTFDKPLPVFPWPGMKAFYNKLDEGPQSWTARVSGFRNFTATVQVMKLSADDTTMVLKFQTTILEDKGGRYLYEDFPMPREAVYRIDMKARDVRQIDAKNWFNGEKCDNRPETVNLTYKMCTKTKKGVPESFPCN